MDNLITNAGDVNLAPNPLDLGQGTGILDNISTQQNQTPPVTGQGEITQPTGNEPPVNQTGQGVEPQDIDYKAEYERMKQSYENLRPAYTKVTQELSTLRRQSQAVVPPNTNTQPNVQHSQPQPPTQQPQQQLYQDPASGQVYYIGVDGRPVIYNGQPSYQNNQQEDIMSYVNKMVQPLYEQTMEAQMQNEIARMAIQRQDFNDVAPVMKQVLEEMPQLWDLGQAKALEVAYSVGRNKLIEQQMATAVNDAKNSVLQNKDVKVLTGGNFTRPAQINQASPADAIKQSILEGANKSSVF